MPLSETDQAKLDQLRADPYKSWRVSELVAVHWPSPDGTIHYCSEPLDILPGYEGLGPRDLTIQLRFAANQFTDLTIDSGVSDDKVDLDFWDGDGEISRLFATHGEGVRVEIFYYFPEVDLLLSQWWGHLRPPTDADGERFKASAENGFLSPKLAMGRRGMYPSCSAVFGGLLETLAEVAENDCPYNKHLDGGTVGELDPDTSEPFKTCPRNRAACTARLGDTLSYLGFDTSIDSYVVGETKGPAITVTTRGNESNLKRPLRVIIGERDVKDLDLLASTPEPNTKHPDQGFISTLWTICEGEIDSQSAQAVNDIPIGIQHLNARNGALRQAKTGFSKQVNNYSGTALFFGRVGPIDALKTTPDQLRGSAHVRGLKTIRVYSDVDTYVEQYTTDRAWALLEMLTNKRWGHGLDHARMNIQDFIDLSAWFAETVTVHDKDGNAVTSTRSTFNAELIDRTAQQQITDLCRSGRCSLPYAENGILRVRPLKKATDDELANAVVFTDAGEDRNICVESNGNSMLTWSMKSDAELTNRIALTYDDASKKNSEVPLIFEDELQQFSAGRAFGDWTRRDITENQTAFGVTELGEAGRLGNLLLDVGEFDEGGLKNNLSWTLTTWWTFTVGLTKYDLVKLVSPKLDRVNDGLAARAEAQGTSFEPFEYFRILSLRRQPDLKVALTVQAYPKQYYADLESSELPPPRLPVLPDDNPGGGRGRMPFEKGFDGIYHGDDRVHFLLEA